MKSSTVICIENEDGSAPNRERRSSQSFLSSMLWDTIQTIIDQGIRNNKRKLIHSIKMGMALVIVSLLQLLDPLHEQVGENAMWAIMTVVVIFESSAGATLSKGLNRGIGTMIGGGLGCLVAVLANATRNSVIIVGISVFLAGAAATYARLVPNIKKRYDYGAMIFILTFNLVAVSGVRAESVNKIARDRLSMIGMGFAVCIFTSLLIFPTWASDQLHSTLPSHFQNLACSIEGLIEEYFKVHDGKESYEQNGTSIEGKCKMVLYSKSSDESLANFARWEPWHGRFGFSHPWDKYLQISEIVRELAAIILSVKACLHHSPTEASSWQPLVKEACEAVACSIASKIRELGESITNMTGYKHDEDFSKLKMENSLAMLAHVENGSTDDARFKLASFVFLLRSMVEKVDLLAKEVEQLGELAHFHPR